MNVSLSVYDLFANTIPGSLYLVGAIYIGVRLGWIDVVDLTGLDTTFAFALSLVASYLLGLILGSPLRRLIDRVHLIDSSPIGVRSEFRRRNPTLAGRPFIDADHFTLLAGLRQVSPDAAVEVERSRAAGIMLRNTSTALLFGAAVACIEALGRCELRAASVGLLLFLLASLSLLEGQRRSVWAQLHTYECAAWMSDLDSKLAPPDEP